MARRRLREDDGGQLMILAAVLLVIGLIALAGMVSRVNQLGSQTAVEADKPILNEIPPLADAIESAVSNLTSPRSVAVTTTSSSATIGFASGLIAASDRGATIAGTGIPAGATITAVPTTTTATISASATATGSITAAVGRHPVTITKTAASATITFTSGVITANDLGLVISGPGIAAGTRLTALPSATSATMSAVATAGGAGTALVGFGLSSTSTPTTQAAVVAVLEQLQAVETGHGFVMDYEITCTGVTNRATGAGGTLTQGLAIVHLSDGTVWIEVRTTSYFARSTCVSVYG